MPFTIPSTRRRRRRRRPLPNPIPLRDPDAELTALIQLSSPPSSTTLPPPAPPTPYLDEAGFIEQASLGPFISSNRTLLRDEVDEEDFEDTVIVPAPRDGDNSGGSTPLLISGGSVSPVSSTSTSSFKSALSSFSSSFRRRDSFSSSTSSTRALRSPVPTKVRVTGEDEYEDFQIVENDWNEPRDRGHRGLNPLVFRAPPAGKSEFDDETLSEGHHKAQ